MLAIHSLERVLYRAGRRKDAMLKRRVPVYRWRESLRGDGVASLVITAGCFGVPIFGAFMSADEEVGCDEVSLSGCGSAILLFRNNLIWRLHRNWLGGHPRIVR